MGHPFSLLLDLFGVDKVAAAAYHKIRLPRTPLIELKEKKLKSLAYKYFSTPTDKLWYYPEPDNEHFRGQYRNSRRVNNSTAKRCHQTKKSPEKEKIARKVVRNKISWKAKTKKIILVLPVPAGQKRIVSFLNFNTV